ncbi:MAG: DUF423 domain-containing protein [Mesonia hippocampi]|uniref:DUF423 domain-containing protein n=1 Tax=Mesonia hippocampi TaxID=1628250 RepID=UPI003F99A766
MDKKLLVLGSTLGFLAVVLGAFGAHGLEKLVTEDAINTFEVGVRYQFYHAFLALFVGVLGKNISARAKLFTFYGILIGVLFFSGSIYGLATNTLSAFDFTSIALITPLGGSVLILVWLCLIIQFIKIKS